MARDDDPDIVDDSHIEPFEKRHRDGGPWPRGQTLNGEPSGFREWFRRDGTRLRSGHFEAGRQVGAWTTYDRKGEVSKATRMKAGD